MVFVIIVVNKADGIVAHVKDPDVSDDACACDVTILEQHVAVLSVDRIVLV